MIKELIKKSPNKMQKYLRKAYYSMPYEKRLGKEFDNTYRLLQESQYWDKRKHEEYQMLELEKLLNHAYENVPYYRKVFDERGIKPKDIQSLDDLKRLPYLTKEIVRDNLKELTSVNYKKKNLKYVSTSGSTGIPLGFYELKRFGEAREWAYITSMWAILGYDINKRNKNVILRGNLPHNDIYEYNKYNGNNLILSSYVLTEENMNKYIQLIKRFEPDFIQAYPSSISILSNFILEKSVKLNLKNLKGIMCASENIYDFQRSKIEEAFGRRMFSHYGHSECCCIAGECEFSRYYHLNSQYGITELIDENGNDVENDDEKGEIIATGFSNYVVPFIRYRTKDLAIHTNKQCSCGRNYPLIKKVVGRMQDLVISSKGEKVICDMVTASVHNDIFKNVKEFQFYQDTLGICKINIVKSTKYNSYDEKKIYSELKPKFGSDIELEFNYTDYLERTKSGKYRFLIQKLNINNWEE